MRSLHLLLIFACMIAAFSFTTHEAYSSDVNLYKVGVNDVLSISVLGHRDLKVLSNVATDGTVSFPNLGSVYVKDKTLDEIKEEITNKLSDGYIKYPVVSVSLIQTKSKQIFMNGEVNHVGAIPFEKDMTIIKAISLAGGISEGGLFGKLLLRRKQNDIVGYKTIINEEINHGIIMNRKVEDMELQSEDILHVERNGTFLIQGEVARRGRFTLEKDMTALRALLEAGGVTTDGRYGKIRLRRKQNAKAGGYEDIAESKINDGVIENKEFEDIVILPEDILYVERNETYLIQGEVQKRGRFVLEKDMTVIGALLVAGGITDDGKHGKIVVRRRQKDESVGYKDITESKISNGRIDNNEVEDTILQPDDIIIIESNKNFFIYGEVNKSGEFVLKNNMTVFKAITIAGGFNKWGAGSRVKVLRSSDKNNELIIIKVDIDDVLDGDANADVTLQPGDTVVVSSGVF